MPTIAYRLKECTATGGGSGPVKPPSLRRRKESCYGSAIWTEMSGIYAAALAEYDVV